MRRRLPRITAPLALLAVPLAVAACLGGAPATDGGASTERRAALARLVVDNQTDMRLAIGFRYAAEPGGEVEVGAVEAGERAELAPVPGGEPIVLFARGPGFMRQLTPRSLAIQQVWTWVIRRDSVSYDG